METTTASPFLNLPNEIFIEILKRCTTFKGAVALAMTCRQLGSIWKNHQKAAIPHIGSNCIVAFDDALKAVRAIDMAERQYQVLAFRSNGVNANVVENDLNRTPARIPIHLLGPHFNPPSPDELIRVFDLKYFVEAALFLGHEQRNIHIFCQQSSSDIRLTVPCQHSVDGSQPATPSATREVDFKIYASMYRFFLVSAVLSSVYWEPFFAVHPQSATLRREFAGPSIVLPQHMPMESLGVEDLSYLRRWACYNKRRASQARLDEVFGDLAEYLVEKGMKEAVWSASSTSTTQQSTEDRDVRSAGAVQTIMMIIGCHELFWCVAQQQLNCAGRAIERSPAWLDGIRYKRIPVTFLGIHGALDACIPHNASDIPRHPDIQLRTRPLGVGSDINGRPLRQVRLLRLFHELLYYDRREGSVDSDLPYELGFFEYVLRRYFGLKVQFEWGYSQTVYSRYLAHGTAFRAVDPFRRNIPNILSRCVL
ncbi:hypothetical protein TWF481_008894 [Arthrobotrys musiformis]|uniref:F-box domain-containing protein n=1 Tax=Arthrobotrys musiformis TaxID=47236 RepID=A0AAV9WEA6_9PEZI